MASHCFAMVSHCDRRAKPTLDRMPGAHEAAPSCRKVGGKPRGRAGASARLRTCSNAKAMGGRRRSGEGHTSWPQRRVTLDENGDAMLQARDMIIANYMTTMFHLRGTCLLPLVEGARLRSLTRQRLPLRAPALQSQDIARALFLVAAEIPQSSLPVLVDPQVGGAEAPAKRCARLELLGLRVRQPAA